MSEDDVRERSPLHEAGPRDWPSAGVVLAAAAAAGGDRFTGSRVKKRSGVTGEFTGSRGPLRPVHKYRGCRSSCQAKSRSVSSACTISTSSSTQINSPTSIINNNNSVVLNTFSQQSIRVGNASSPQRTNQPLTTFAPYPRQLQTQPAHGGGQSHASPPPPRKRSSNPSSPDIGRKPAVPEKSPNLGKNSRPSRLPIVSVYGNASNAKQPCLEQRPGKLRKTSADINAYPSSAVSPGGHGDQGVGRRQDLHRPRTSPTSSGHGRGMSPKRGEVRRGHSPTLPVWRRSPSSSRSRQSSPSGAGSPLLGGRRDCQPPSPTTSPGRRRATRPGSPAVCKGTRPPSPRGAVKRHPSPSQLDPHQAECVRNRVGLLEKVKFYLLQQVGVNSFLVSDENINLTYKVNIGPQTCSCLKGPGCLHLLFIMLRVFKISTNDSRLTARVLKEYEIESLLRTYQERRETRIKRNRQQNKEATQTVKSGGGANSVVPGSAEAGDTILEAEEEDAMCPICLSEMAGEDDICTCSNCNNDLHTHCMSVWRDACSSQGESVRCPLCRETFKSLTSATSRLHTTSSYHQERSAAKVTTFSSPYQHLVPAPYAASSKTRSSAGSSAGTHGTASMTGSSGYGSLVSRTSDTQHMIEQNGRPEDIPLPKNEPIPVQHWQMASTWLNYLERDLVACLVSKEWINREIGLRRLAREIVQSLQSSLDYSEKFERACRCFEILQHLLEDKVYKVYVAAIKCLGALLNFFTCHDNTQLQAIQGQVGCVLQSVVVKCSEAKKISEVSIDTLVEVAKGRDGDMGIGRHVAGSLAYSGLDLVLWVLLGDDQRADHLKHQWNLGRLILVERLLYQFADQFSLETNNAQVNLDRLKKVLDLSFQHLTSPHTNVAKLAQRVLTAAALNTFTDNDTFQQVWKSLEVLDSDLEIRLRKTITAAVEKQYLGKSQGSSSSSSPGSPQICQDKSFLLETFLNACSNRHCAASPAGSSSYVGAVALDGEKSASAGKKRRPPLLRSTSHSPSRAPHSITNTTSESPNRSVKARSPPLYSSQAAFSSKSRMASTRLAEKSKMSRDKLTKYDLSLLSDQLAMEMTANMDIDPTDFCQQQIQAFNTNHLVFNSTTTTNSNNNNNNVPRMEKSSLKFGGPITRSRSTQMEQMLREVMNNQTGFMTSQEMSQGVVKSGSCKDVMDFELNFSRRLYQDEALPHIPALSLETTTDMLSHPHQQGLEDDEMRGREYLEGRDWTKGAVLGTGAFSICYHARDVQTGTLMAAKQISFSRNSQEEQRKVEELVREEISLMSRLQHPHIVRMFGAIQEGDHINVFEEWMPGGSIAALLDKHGPFTHQVIVRYTRQILLGIDYLHTHGILHRDIKGANLLVDSSGHHLRIADLGAAARMIATATIQGQFKGDLQGTIAFMAPEVLKGDSYGRACDIWSLGCTIIEMATTKPPWGAADISNHLTLIFVIACSEGPPSIPEALSPGIKEITVSCLRLEPSQRPTSRDLLLHPVLQYLEE